MHNLCKTLFSNVSWEESRLMESVQYGVKKLVATDRQRLLMCPCHDNIIAETWCNNLVAQMGKQAPGS